MWRCSATPGWHEWRQLTAGASRMGCRPMYGGRGWARKHRGRHRWRTGCARRHSWMSLHAWMAASGPATDSKRRVGVRVSEPSLGLDIEARGRTLQLRSERERDVWGASLTARLSPGSGGKGLSFSISPRWGTSPQEAGALRRDDVFRLADKPLSASGDRGSVDARADYGLSVGAGTLTPFSELGLRGGDDRRLRIGVRFAAGSGQRGSVTFEVRGDRHEYGGRDPDHRIGLTGNLRF